MEEYMEEETSVVANTMILDIDFEPEETDMIGMLDAYNKIGYDAFYKDHYALSAYSDYSPIEWKKFLQDPRIAAFVAEETEILMKNKALTMLKTVDTNRNAGQAQLLSTLLNQTKKEQTKEGPVFIYTYIPLNDNEKKARNVNFYESKYSDIYNPTPIDEQEPTDEQAGDRESQQGGSIPNNSFDIEEAELSEDNDRSNTEEANIAE